MSLKTCLFINVKQVKDSLEHIEEILKNTDENQKLSDLSYDDLDNILYRSEKIGLSCRVTVNQKGVPESLYSNGVKRKKDYKTYAEEVFNFEPNAYDDISTTFENDMLILKTPVTLKRFKRDDSVKENYILIYYAQEKIEKCVNQNFEKLSSFEKPLTVIMKRKYTVKHARLIADNDNMENGRIINCIFDSLCRSDNVKEMDVLSCARQVSKPEEEGMEFYLFPTKDLIKHLELLKS